MEEPPTPGLGEEQTPVLVALGGVQSRTLHPLTCKHSSNEMSIWRRHCPLKHWLPLQVTPRALVSKFIPISGGQQGPGNQLQWVQEGSSAQSGCSEKPEVSPRTLASRKVGERDREWRGRETGGRRTVTSMSAPFWPSVIS